MPNYNVYFRTRVWKELKRARRTHKISQYLNDLLEREQKRELRWRTAQRLSLGYENRSTKKKQEAEL